MFDEFEVSKAPDMRVYLVEGDGEVSGDNFKDVGSLKAEKGQFQYEIDAEDAERYLNVVVWCRAFSVGFARAPLEAS